MELETRQLQVPIEVEESGSVRRLRGYAAVFNTLSHDLGGFRERIDPGAFDEALASDDDVAALVNHDSTLVLGKRSNGTLELFADDHGLGFSVELPDTTYANDLAATVARGDTGEMSFGFKKRSADGDRWETTPEGEVRTLTNVTLLDVSPVTFPAYPKTDVALRALYEYRSARSPEMNADVVRRIAQAEARNVVGEVMKELHRRRG